MGGPGVRVGKMEEEMTNGATVFSVFRFTEGRWYWGKGNERLEVIKAYPPTRLHGSHHAPEGRGSHASMMWSLSPDQETKTRWKFRSRSQLWGFGGSIIQSV